VAESLERILRVRCPLDHAFAAFTQEVDLWWPRRHRRYEDSRLVLEAEVGGRFFGAFASVMQKAPEQKTLLHCQVNFRASAFSFLYRVIYEGVPVGAAKADMNSVWQPSEPWRELIFEVLDQHGISPDCEGCNWDVPATR
jgi:hypothetical protein